MIGFYLVVWFTLAAPNGDQVFVSTTGASGPMEFTECHELAKQINEVHGPFIRSDIVHAECNTAENSHDYMSVRHAIIPSPYR